MTERTFFRHFADKREVLFAGDLLAAEMAKVLAAAPADATPLEAVTLAIKDAAEVITANPDWSRARQRIVAQQPDLRERELSKMAMLANVMAEGLQDRGVARAQAMVVAELGALAFRLAYDRWATTTKVEPLKPFVRELLSELKDAAAAPGA